MQKSGADFIIIAHTHRYLFRSRSRWQIYVYINHNIYIYYIYNIIHIVQISYKCILYINYNIFLGSIFLKVSWVWAFSARTGCLHWNSEVESGLSNGRADAQQRLLGSLAKVAGPATQWKFKVKSGAKVFKFSTWFNDKSGKSSPPSLRSDAF